MKLRLLATTSYTLLFFGASINAVNREVLSIPFKNSIVIKGQDQSTISPNKYNPRLYSAACGTRRYPSFIVTDAAEAACRAIKRSINLKPFKKYPKAYRPIGVYDSFEIPGNPYYIFPIDYKGNTYGQINADFVAISERCQLAGVFTLTNGKSPKQEAKSKRKRRRALRKSRSFVKKCVLNIYNPRVPTKK